MPTITNGEVPAALEGLRELAQIKLPVAGALRIRKLTRALQEHWDDIMELYRQFARACCMLDEHGEPVQERLPDGTVTSPFRDDAARDEFQQRWKELMAEEITHPYGVEVAHLGTADIAAESLIKLGALFIDDEPDSSPGG